MKTSTKLANQFLINLEKNMSQSEWLDFLQLNHAIIQNNETICASHDFCDANRVMIESMNDLSLSDDTLDIEVCALINNAWFEAKHIAFDYVI